MSKACFTPLLIIALAIAMVAGCGSVSNDERSDVIEPLGLREAALPVSYALADPECQSSPDSTAIAEAYLWQWHNDEVAGDWRALTDVVSSTSVHSRAVNKTTFGGRYERICNYQRPQGKQCINDFGNEIDYRTRTAPTNLKVCEGRVEYRRDAIETVALSGVAALERAYLAYTRASGLQTEGVHLAVLPEFADIYDNYYENGERMRKKVYATHNSAYFPSVKMIVIFPEREEWLQWLAGYLWESDFVLAHEFGHHLERVTDNGFRSTFGAKWRSPLRQELQNLTGSGSSSRREKMWGAVSEAFADLVGHYTLDGDISSLRGLPCFGYNRSVSFGQFADGQTKAFDAEISRYFYGEQAQPAKERQSCSDPKFSDIHTVGAILAHTLDLGFTRLVRGTISDPDDGNSDRSRHYRLALSWLRETKKAAAGMPAQAGGNDLMAAVSRGFEAVASQYLSVFNLSSTGVNSAAAIEDDLCRIIDARLSAVTHRPFSDRSDGCAR